MAEDLGPEQAVHGSPWGQMHGGYFSDPAVAQPLVDAVRDVWRRMRPDRIVDLGGGTGFLLSRLRVAGFGADAVLVNLDGSVPQLSEAEKAGFACIRGSVDAFRRSEAAPPGQPTLWVMRSVLHYAGEGGLDAVLRHLRAQAEPGEGWVHQTACFEREEDADCLNALYRKMRTGKWYPTVADLRARMAAAGWRTETVRPAPPLHLESGDLGIRYGLNKEDLAAIRSEMETEFGGRSSTFQTTSAGFHADLHYRIFVCRAAVQPLHPAGIR
ncbi:MAG: methyltransferase domain-containing protein [Kiritimatiellia bacterium]